ncbi:MAG: hypothetical protein ACI9JN_001601 [Bacteroidia bacterium]|jgi:hypothetical protein
MTLLPFIVLFTDTTFTLPEWLLFQAEDSEHAEEQLLSENPSADVTWIVQTDDVDIGFETYHRESTCEETA